MAGVTITFKNPTDATRFVVLDLKKRPHTEIERRSLAEAFAQFDADFGAQLMRRMIERLDDFKLNLAAFRTVVRNLGGDDRTADLHGHLMAGYWTACHDVSVTADQAAEALSWLDTQREDDQDARDCLNHLLGHRIALPLNATVAECLDVLRCQVESARAEGQNPNDSTTYARALEQLGVRYDEATDRMIVANRARGTLEVYQRTRWRDGAHAKRLKSLGGDNCENRTINFTGVRSKATGISCSIALDDEDEGKAGDDPSAE